MSSHALLAFEQLCDELAGRPFDAARFAEQVAGAEWTHHDVGKLAVANAMQLAVVMQRLPEADRVSIVGHHLSPRARDVYRRACAGSDPLGYLLTAAQLELVSVDLEPADLEAATARQYMVIAGQVCRDLRAATADGLSLVHLERDDRVGI